MIYRTLWRMGQPELLGSSEGMDDICDWTFYEIRMEKRMSRRMALRFETLIKGFFVEVQP